MIEPRHRVDLYLKRSESTGPQMPPSGGEDEWGNEMDATPEGTTVRTEWESTPVAPNVPANIQPLTGDVEQTAAGREVNATAAMFVLPEDLPDGIELEPDMGVVVTAGRGPTRYRITRVGHRAGPGSGWKDKALLRDTEELIP